MDSQGGSGIMPTYRPRSRTVCLQIHFPLLGQEVDESQTVGPASAPESVFPLALQKAVELSFSQVFESQMSAPLSVGSPEF